MGLDGADMIGFLAGSLVLTTFCMKSMLRLRIVAVLSNIAFVAYALIEGLLPVLVLHGMLLPINAIWLLQAYAATPSEKRSFVE